MMKNPPILTDLHTHILPGIDDGARDVSVSETILRAEQEDAVSQILFTPHFYADFMDAEIFLRRRQMAYESIAPFCGEHGTKTALVPYFIIHCVLKC